MRFLKSYGVALLILVGIAGWMLTGTLIQGGRGPGQGERPMIDAVDGEGGPLRGLFEALGIVQPVEETPVVAAAQVEVPQEVLASVRAARFTAEDLAQTVLLRGQTQANAVVAARAQTTGTVQQVHVRKGQAVEAGQLLCSIDSGTRAVRVATAEAQLVQAQADLENNVTMRDRGVVPANTARQYEVALLSAQAAYDDAVAELERTEIHADVSGLIEDPLASVGDMLSAGTECATIIQLDPAVFSGEVPEAQVGLISQGETALITTVTGQQVAGEVRFVSASANAATRTFTVEIEVPNADGAIRDGLSAQATIEVGTMRAHLVPQSVLTLDADGVLGARAVEDDIVGFYPVQIVRDTREGSWVTGLPDTVDIITLGQEYVQEGQRVEAAFATSNQGNGD